MSLMVSLCLFWKVWRSWRALMVYGQTLVVVGLVVVGLVKFGLVVRLPIVLLVQVLGMMVRNFLSLRLVFLWPRRNC